MRYLRKAPWSAAASAAALALAVAGCAGSTSPSAGGSGSAAASVTPVKASGTRVHVIVLGGSLSDPFWSSVARAVHDAGAASATEGGSVTYLGPQNYNNFGPDMARLEQSALAQHPSAVVSANWLPGDQSPGLKAIARAGIPLFEFNNGEGTWKSDGATGFVGSNEYQGGVVAGRTLVSAGVKNAICVNTVPGAQELENRCNGVRAALRASGGKAKTLELSSTTFSDPTSVTQAIKGALLSDPSVDGLITIAANDGDYAADAIQQAGRSGKVKLGAFGLSMSNLNRIQRGQELLAIDIQPYLQGYYAVSMAFQYAKWGLLPSGHVFYTGPVLITKTNVARAIATSKDGIRGTS